MFSLSSFSLVNIIYLGTCAISSIDAIVAFVDYNNQNLITSIIYFLLISAKNIFKFYSTNGNNIPILFYFDFKTAIRIISSDKYKWTKTEV